MAGRKDSILIIGAGLCGSLLALRLAQRGYKVRLVEKRPDLRKVEVSAGRSINLAFSDRGIKAMDLVGITDKTLALCIPMKGRAIHDSNGEVFLSPYSGRSHEYINSISRGDLNGLLLTEADNHNNVAIDFNMKCLSVDIEKTIASFYDYETKATIEIDADIIIGTDGAGSVLRKSYYLERKFLFSYSQNFLSHGYKELSIPAKGQGGFRLEKNALHIWPRGAFMLIALPNLDGSFTATLFLSYDDGQYNFTNLTSSETISAFFKKEFPDAWDQMPNLTEEFKKNPVGPLGTVKCSPWNYLGNTLLMGDAAHAIVPFYGQGMNASFEDVIIFDEILEKHQGNWQASFKEYERMRKVDTDAIADLAVDNFHEMKDHVANPIFKEKRKIEMSLEHAFPEQYASKYSMVTFREDMPYSRAMQLGRAQDKAILNLLSDKKIAVDGDLNEIFEKINKETQEIIEEDTVAKTMKH